MVEEGMIKRAVVAGASAALKVQRTKRNISEAKIIEEVVSQMDSIIDKIDRE